MGRREEVVSGDGDLWSSSGNKGSVHSFTHMDTIKLMKIT
jgi:hypothetical protein